MDDLILILMAFEGVVLGLMAIVALFGIGCGGSRYHRGTNKRLPRYM